MEIDITNFVANEDAYEFSASIAERGQNAGPETWANATAQAERKPLLQTEAELDALRNHVRSFGAWEESELIEWSVVECNALFIQLVSGDLREAEALCSTDDGEIDWTKYEALAQHGTIGGNMYSSGDKIFYSLQR